MRATLSSHCCDLQQWLVYLVSRNFFFLFAFSFLFVVFSFLFPSWFLRARYSDVRGFSFQFVSFCFLFPHRSLGTQNLELNDIARIITENAIVIHDPDHSDDEDRFVLLGMSAKLRVLVVCHCYRMNDDCVRLISARKAAKREQHQYFERGKQ